MSNVLRQRSGTHPGKVLAGKAAPAKIEFRGAAGPNRVHFADGATADASCLHCHDAPCYRYAEGEGECSSLENLPADRTADVCPTGAISITSETGAAFIDADQCIYCGVCVSRCPVGAISFPPNVGATVALATNSHFVATPEYSETAMRASRDALQRAVRVGVFLKESDDLIKDIERRLNSARKHLPDSFPNLLARNLLRAVGVSVDMRRTGNNHLRADLVLGPDGVKQGVVEVEFGDEAILDAPRDLLDDIAVFVSRHGWAKDETVAFIVGDVLPNRRSEFWQIIRDIRDVLGIQLGTMTVLGLMLLVWERKKLPSQINKVAYADCDTTSYREAVLEKLLGRHLALGADISAIVEVVK